MPDFRRLAPRLAGFDYAESGMYFVTVCLAQRIDRLGHVDDSGQVGRSAAGEMLWTTWHQMPTQFADVAVDTVIVMPDHLHGIVFVGVDPESDRRTSLNDLMRWFKSVTTTRYAAGVRKHAWLPFDGQLWQRSYYDRILRNDHDLARCRQYIEDNPSRWFEKRSQTQ